MRRVLRRTKEPPRPEREAERNEASPGAGGPTSGARDGARDQRRRSWRTAMRRAGPVRSPAGGRPPRLRAGQPRPRPRPGMRSPSRQGATPGAEESTGPAWLPSGAPGGSSPMEAQGGAGRVEVCPGPVDPRETVVEVEGEAVADPDLDTGARVEADLDVALA